MLGNTLKAVLVAAKRKAAAHQYQQLIITDEYIYPPRPRDIKEILLSQYATAILDEHITNSSEQKIDRKNKFPLPIVFAFLENYLRGQKYELAVRLLQNNVEKKATDNYHIVTFVMAKIYEMAGEYKKNVFFLENLLKEQPFFSEAVHDLCRAYSQRFGREQEAIKILERHITGSLGADRYIQALYLGLSAKYSKKSMKEIAKNMSGRCLTLSNYYNLGLLLKSNEDYQKAEQIFSEIVVRLGKIKQQKGSLILQKDRKLLLLSKVNLILVMEKIQITSKTREHYIYQICESLLKEHSYQISHQDKEKIEVKMRHLPIYKGEQSIMKSLNLSNLPSEKRYAQERTEEDFGLSKSNKENSLKLNSFNEEYSNFREYNNKKLKYLLIKERQINNFFKNLVIKKENFTQQYKIIYKCTDTIKGLSSHQSLIRHAKNELNQEEIQLFQKQFEEKRKIHEFKYNNVEIESILKQILKNLENCTELPPVVPEKSAEKPKIPLIRETSSYLKQGEQTKRKLMTSSSYRTLRSDRNNFRIKQNTPKQTMAIKSKESKATPPIEARFTPPIKSSEEIQNQEVSDPDIVSNAKINIEEIFKAPEAKYDPMASSFQLTGFNNSSIGKFMSIKRKKSQQKRGSLFNFPKPNFQTDQIIQDHVKSQFDLQLEKALNLEKEEKYDEAYEAYTNMYKSFKKQTEKQEILMKIGGLFEKQDKHLEAEKTYMKCTKFNNVQAFMKLGSLLLKNGRIKSGVENLQKANCIKRYDLEIQNKLVYGYSLKQQTMEKALTLAHTILKKEPESLQTLIMTANILEKQGKIKEAIEIVTAIDKFKEAEYIKYYLGILYLEDSNLTESFNFFKAALTIKPDHVPSLIEVATIISDISPKQSISILNKVLQIQPANRKALARLGKIYESIENDFQNAMLIYKTALEAQQNYESYMKIGDCFAKKQSYIQALLNYKEALNLRKTHEAYAKIANMFEKKGENIKAIENYQLSLDMMSKQKEGYSFSIRKEYLISMGKLNMQIFNYDSAINSFEEILEQEQSMELFKLLAQAEFGKKQYTIALEYYEKANELAKGEDIEILENVAICFDKMEEYLASKAIYEKILENNPDNIKCINNLANILLIIGETNEAFYLFQNMLQKAPKNIEKRLKVADIYAYVGDWSKVEYHLLQCFRQRQHDPKILQKLITLYKEKRDIKLANKYQKKLALIKASHKHHKQT